VQRGYGGQQLAAVPDRGDTHFLQVIRGEFREHGEIHPVLSECLLVLAETDAQ
jgi:hypothetical protein